MQEEEAEITVEPIVFGSLTRPNEVSRDEPCQRRFHSAAVHKNMVYIFGGIPVAEPADPENEQRTLYRYNAFGKNWSQIPTAFAGNASFSFVSGHSAAFMNNSMFLVSGRNYRTDEYLLGVWSTTIDSSNKATWKRQDIKGYSPGPRQHAAFVAHQRSTIILYGGEHRGEVLNDCHIYRTDNKLWVAIDEYSYDMRLECRLKPGLCSLNDHLYLFGGEKSVLVQDEVQYEPLNDFHQIRLLNRPMNSRLDVWVKRIVTHYGPTPRVGSLLAASERVLFLWGGDNGVGEDPPARGVWAYYVSDYTWHWVRFKVATIPALGPGSSISSVGDKCFIFGQYSNPADHTRSGLQVLNVDPKQVEARMEAKKSKQPNAPNQSCSECSQHSQTINYKFKDHYILREALGDGIEWVFSAFGLLVDNTTLLGATDCRVVFHATSKEKFCMIQDNGNPALLWEKGSDFISDLLSMRTYVEANIDQLDQFRPDEHTKKNILDCEVLPAAQPAQQAVVPGAVTMIKESKEQKEMKEKELRDKEEERQLRRRKEEAKRAARKRTEERKQYSRNMKIGGLRIGDRVLLVSRFGSNNEHKRVFCIQRIDGREEEDTEYVAYYYQTENNLLAEGSGMEAAKRYIDEEYKPFLKMANERKQQGGNCLFVSRLREVANENGQAQVELKESQRHGDVLCCEKRQLETLEEGVLTESLDMSLKHYLELLYLKSEEFKIWLELSDRRAVEVSNLEMFDRIDQLVKSQRIIDLEEALDLEQCNIIEVYYNHSPPGSTRSRDSKSKTAHFHALNGVLFYHRNRLINRYHFPLGELSKLFRGRHKQIAPALAMFGFIEIKEEYQANIFKNKFVREDLLESIYHRLRFVERYAERVAQDDPPRGRKEEGSPRKRTKPNEELPADVEVIEIE